MRYNCLEAAEVRQMDFIMAESRMIQTNNTSNLTMMEKFPFAADIYSIEIVVLMEVGI